MLGYRLANVPRTAAVPCPVDDLNTIRDRIVKKTSKVQTKAAAYVTVTAHLHL